MTSTEDSEDSTRDHPTEDVDHRGFWEVLERFAGTLVNRFDLDDVLAQLGTDVQRILNVAGAVGDAR